MHLKEEEYHIYGQFSLLYCNCRNHLQSMPRGRQGSFEAVTYAALIIEIIY